MSIRERLIENKSRIIVDYNNGITTAAIGKYMNCNSGTVWYLLKEWGVKTRARKKFKGKITDYKEQILEMQKGGESGYAIAQKLKLCDVTVCKYLKKWGVDISQNCKRDDNNLLKDKKDLVLQLYREGNTNDQIGEIVGHSGSSIWRLLDSEGIHQQQNTYDVDTHFFDVLDTEQKAYIFGLALADGNVMNDGTFRIALQEDDEEILIKIKDILGYTGPLHYKEKRGTSRRQSELCINRVELTRQLIAKGCVPAKSMILEFPSESIVPDSLLHHMIRGYFDGDGSCTPIYCNVVSNLVFITELSNILNSLKIEHKIYQRYKSRKPEDSSHQLFVLKREHREKFLRFLYSNATIFLRRKALAALTVLPDLGIVV